MKKGFTMIELIFVIIIIGILAAFALPKLTETTTDAKKSIMESFVGTLNRTVGPSMWMRAIKQNSGNGSIAYLTGGATDLEKYTDIPKEISRTSIDFSKCKQILSDGDKFATFTIGSNNYAIYCKDGDDTTSPRFGFDTSLAANIP